MTMAGTVPVAASLAIEEPNLSGTPTLAATLYIKDAPDEGTTNAAIYVAAGNTILADGTGLVVGHTALIAAATDTASFQVLGVGADTQITQGRWSNNAGAPTHVFAKSRGTTVGTWGTVVADGDTLGVINWVGDDGTDANSSAAQIYAQVDGSPGGNDMPGRIVMATTADGAASPTEALRINASQHVRLAQRLVIDGNNGVLFEDAGKWGISYGTQVAGWATIGDASVYNGVAIYPGSVLYTNFPADGTIQPEYQGAVGTPTYSFQDDPNTGMYQSQADYLDFAAGGVYGLNIRTDKVNIPLTKLDLNGARFQKTSTADVTSSSGTVSIGNAWGSAPTVKFVRSFRSESGYTFRLDQIVTYGSTCTVVAGWGASHSELTYSSATGALRVAVSTGTFAFEVLEFYS